MPKKGVLKMPLANVKWQLKYISNVIGLGMFIITSSLNFT